MRSPHRVVCALALSALLGLVCWAYAGNRIGTGVVPREWETLGVDPAKAAAEVGTRVELPSASDSLVYARDRVARVSAERVTDRKAGAATATPRPLGVTSREVRRDRAPRSQSVQARVASSGWGAPIEFDRISVAPGALSVGVTGVDWGAPRPLVLWRMEGEEYARLATARSREDGHFDFGQVVVPNRGLELAVTALGAQPSPADWARGLELQPSELYE